MLHSKTVRFRVCRPSEQQSLSDFLWSMRTDFHFTERSITTEVAQLLFAKGGVVSGYVNDTMVGTFDYFLGEPSHDFANKEVGFIYIAGIANAYRRAGVFRNGLHFLATTLQHYGVTEMRCHARKDDAYTNGLYARLGPAIGTEKNRRGDTCILYANSVANVLALTSRRRKRERGPHLRIS